MYHPAKLQRILKTTELSMAASTEHGDPLLLAGDGRRGQSLVGGDLRLDILSSLKGTEAEILDMMMKAVKQSESKTVVRVAGGWVRDKLLGRENEDIDIALDDCTGVAFAEVVNAYLKSKGEDEGKVAVIEANPEQSKHLQTARMKIMGLWIDLVNLRTETYKSDSRIPEASFGTAEEDASRRDFTVNALFFNVNDGKVEDMTGRGIDDLRKGIICTPLPPMVTFLDDPLRVMRAVRFAARFGFSLHEDLRTAAQDEKIRAALESKVSRERVGAELSGMLTGKMAQPALALSMVQELGLAPAVYALPEHLVPSPPEEGYDWSRGALVARAAARLLAFREGIAATGGKVGRLGGEAIGHPPLAAAGITAEAGVDDGKPAEEGVRGGAGETPAAVGRVEDASDAVKMGKSETREPTKKQPWEREGSAKPGLGDGAEKGSREGSDCCKHGENPVTLVRELFLCAALLPLATVKHRAKKGKLLSAAQSVVQESLKLKSKEAKNVGDVLDLMPTFRSLVDAYAASVSGAGGGNGEKVGSGTEFSRLAVGLALRQARELWPTCIDLCCAVEMCESQEKEPSPTDAGTAVACRQGQTEADNTASIAGKRARVDGGCDGDGKHDSESGLDGADRAVIEKYTGFREAVAGMGLGRAWEIPPLVRGNELMSELQVPKGPQVGELMAKQASWQLEHPEGTREQCVAFLRLAL